MMNIPLRRHVITLAEELHFGSRAGTTSSPGVRKALEHVPPERIHLTGDCGQFALPRQIARGKLVAMAMAMAMAAAAAAEQLRSEIGS